MCNFLFASGNERTRVACKSVRSAMQKSVLQTLYQLMLKRQITPISRKNQCQFFRHVTSGIHWNISATVLLCFIAGKRHGSVNIVYPFIMLHEKVGPVGRSTSLLVISIAMTFTKY